MLATLAAVGALALPHLHGPHLFGHTPPTVKLYQQRFGDWSLDVREDGFAHRSTCRLFVGRSERSTRIEYEDGFVAFEFSPKQETKNAWYQVDDRPPQSEQAALPRRPARFAAAGSLDSTTGGLVFVPADYVVGGQVIAIRTRDKLPVRKIKVAGLGEALADARARGCVMEPVP